MEYIRFTIVNTRLNVHRLVMRRGGHISHSTPAQTRRLSQRFRPYQGKYRGLDISFKRVEFTIF